MHSTTLLQLASLCSCTSTAPFCVVQYMSAFLLSLCVDVCVDVCVDAGCCSVHYQNLKRREAIQHIAGNPNYDADLERLRVLKFSRDDYRSVALLAALFHLPMYILQWITIRH